jgi:FtsP/CotA-like multicopper oxidase with cupredoxin domain
MWTVNGQLFDLSASVAQPQFGTVERWRFSSDFHHPIHLHLVHFQLLSRNGRPPQPSDGGWKDTVDVRPYASKCSPTSTASAAATRCTATTSNTRTWP